MSIVSVNGTKASGSGTSLTLPAYDTSGPNLLVLYVGVFAYSPGLNLFQLSMPRVTDSVGNKWETIGATPCAEAVYGSGFDSSWQLFAFYVRRCQINTAIINIALPGDACAIGAILREYSGLSNTFPLDVFQVNEAEAASLAMSVDTGTVTTTQTLELLCSACFDNGNGDGTSQTFTPSVGFTTRDSLSDAVNSLNLAAFDKTASGTGTFSNTVSANNLSDGLHAIIIGFAATPIPTPIVQVASSFGSPDDTFQGEAIAPFGQPNTPNNSIILLVWGGSDFPSDTAGNLYENVLSISGIEVWLVKKCLGGPNIVQVTGLSGIGNAQCPIVALETYPALYYGNSSSGSVSPGVRANTGLVDAAVGDLLLLFGSEATSGINGTQQLVGDPFYQQASQYSGLGEDATVPWGACLYWRIASEATSYGAGIQVASAVDLTAALIDFAITYPTPSSGPTNSLIVFDTSYNRWRNQSYNVGTMFYEADTNTLLFTTKETGGYAVREVEYQDYEDGGWNAGSLVQTPIPVDIQLPYQDLKLPHFPKQWNMVELDVNTKGQDLTIILHFDEDVAPITLAVVNTVAREKVQLAVNAGDGQESYRCSPELQMSVTIAPIIYQLNIYAAVLAANRNTFDTYWIKFNNDESKLAKEGYFDYTSTAAITVELYADGNTVPYYTFTLPANATRSQVPERVRFPALKFRLWRLVMTSTAAFQMWNAPIIRVKPCLVGSGYSNADLTT